MTIATKLGHFLQEQQIPFNTIRHEPSHSSVQSAVAAQVPLGQVAKAVILKDSVDNYLMAVIPASSRVQIKQMNQVTDSQLKLATEKELSQQFSDCQRGAIPPVGTAYNMATIWDERLAEVPDVYLEAGDHETMIHLTQKAFQNIMSQATHDELCVPPRTHHEDDC